MASLRAPCQNSPRDSATLKRMAFGEWVRMARGATPSTGQTANCQYQVTNETLAANEAYYFLILTGAENAAYNSLAPSDSSGNKLERQFNTTLVVSNGADLTIRYRRQIRFRGNSRRACQFKPLRVSIPNDDPWSGMTGFNVNSKASSLNFLRSARSTSR